MINQNVETSPRKSVALSPDPQDAVLVKQTSDESIVSGNLESDIDEGLYLQTKEDDSCKI